MTVEVGEAIATEDLPPKVTVDLLAARIGREHPQRRRLDAYQIPKFHEESQWAINFRRSDQFLDWIDANADGRLAARSALEALITNSDAVTADRFTLGIAFQLFSEGNVEEADKLLQRLPHPSKLSTYLQAEIARSPRPPKAAN